jgi:hypothetical protein
MLYKEIEISTYILLDIIKRKFKILYEKWCGIYRTYILTTLTIMKRTKGREGGRETCWKHLSSISRSLRL